MKRRWRIWIPILVVAALVMVAVIFITKERFIMNENSSTASFIQDHMTNPNGTLASYLQDARSENPDIVAGREALSESLGLWMQYAVAKNDQAMFEQSYELLKTYFLMPQKYIAWKLDADGTSHVTTNALGDDFRIVDALLAAADKWADGSEDKLSTAAAISRVLTESVQQHGYYVDFHDFSSDYSPDSLSMVYVDLPTLKAMESHEVLQPGIYAKYESLLESMPDDGVFYAKTFDPSTKQFTYGDTVNLIDQLIVANHLMETQRKPGKLITFLKQEMNRLHYLPGQYNRTERTPAVSYESPAVYGLAIDLAIRSDDPKWAKQLYKRMVKLRDQDSRYPGGYVSSGNTHMFDNLVALLGETKLYFFLKKD